MNNNHEYRRTRIHNIIEEPDSKRRKIKPYSIKKSIEEITQTTKEISEQLQIIQEFITTKNKEDGGDLREFSTVSTKLREIQFNTGLTIQGFETYNIECHQNWNQRVRENKAFLERIKNRIYNRVPNQDEDKDNVQENDHITKQE